MNLLIPGRHHLATSFQAAYLFRFFCAGMDGESDSEGRPLSGKAERAVFAVTSADHEATRRNPLPFAARAMALHELGRELGIDLLVYGIPEAGSRPDFAEYTLKTIRHESEGLADLTPENTVVVCATPVADLYRALGFRIWKGERSAGDGRDLPWQLVERIAASADWMRDPLLLEKIHPASIRILSRYGLDRKLRRVLSDPLLGADGDLTETRDYGSYVRQMDGNIESKWTDTAPYVKAGRIGDIGCAVGSWIAKAAREPRLANSDFYGIEITRALYDICVQRRHNGEFATPNVWFAQRNAVEGTVFRPGSMTTVHTSSLTHEIESYAGRSALRAFVANRHAELEDGGVWINRDVIGPEDGDREVLLDLRSDDGADPAPGALSFERKVRDADRAALSAWLAGLSTASRFLVFAADFRAAEGGGPIRFSEEPASLGSLPGTSRRFRLGLRDACEFLSKKDYTDNWQSEMHETFCYWSLSDWKKELESAGFSVAAESRAWTNPWILEHRWLGKSKLHESDGAELPWPPTNAIIVARKG